MNFFWYKAIKAIHGLGLIKVSNLLLSSQLGRYKERWLLVAN